MATHFLYKLSTKLNFLFGNPANNVNEKRKRNKNYQSFDEIEIKNIEKTQINNYGNKKPDDLVIIQFNFINFLIIQKY